MKSQIFLFCFFLAISSFAYAKPKLVVAVVIDQFRADNIPRYQSRFLPAKSKNGEVGGFKYLMEKGAYFPFAQYDILQPMTGPGHASILSGSYPYLSGIPMNDWYDEKIKDYLYCVEDPGFTTVGKTTSAKHVGTSPRNFIGTTIGDELKNAGWPTRVVSISVKDRSAILMGGHRADVALWMDPYTFNWVSSDYYFKDKKLPSWVEKLNAEIEAHKGEIFEWKLPEGIVSEFSSSEIPVIGKFASSIGNKFPHKASRASIGEITSPAGLDLTQKAVEMAVTTMKLGEGKGTDVLAVSFSSHDYVGHGFGPNSRENEEMVVAEDKVISRLLGFLQRKVPGGLKNVTLVLTSDHGVAPNADYLTAAKITSAAIDVPALKAKIEDRLTKKFGDAGTSGWIAFTEDFNFWIRREALAARKVPLEDVAEEIKKALLAEDAFGFAFTFADVANRKLPPGMHERRILKTFVLGRSGDVIGILKPFHYAKELTANHMADYSYDESVPLILMGEGVKPGKYATKAEVVDIAPTLSFLLDTLPPAQSEGRVLSEALTQPAGKN